MFLFGCSGPQWTPQGDPSPGTTVTARADWNDLDAAIEVAAPKLELGLEGAGSGVTDQGLRQRTWTFLDLHDERSVVTATAPHAGNDRALMEAGTLQVTLFARVGERGDTTREARLLAALRKRLGDLAGVDTAPLE